MSLHDGMPNHVYKAKENKKCAPEVSSLDPGTSYEVFRNNTTAVEVIVKDVLNKRRHAAGDHDVRANVLEAEVRKLQMELAAVSNALASTRQGFRGVVAEMRKQIDTATSREADERSRNLTLKLENEKLKILLASKTKLICKLKKEMVAMKRCLKFVLKSVCNAPPVPENVSAGSESEYEDFEMDLKSNCRVRFAEKTINETLDSTLSKDSYFDKKL